MTWRAVDGDGRDLATGRAPCWPGHADPAAALAAAPVAGWPVAVAGDDGSSLSLGQALGPGGGRVEGLLHAVTGATGVVDVPALARATPVGPVDLPLDVVTVPEGVEAAGRVDGTWLAAVDRARGSARDRLLASGRHAQVEAAVHVAVLVATERFEPADRADVGAHVASGARLWLLAGAVVSALAGRVPDPFQPWGSLVAAGWWPVGPSGGRLVVSAGAADAMTGPRPRPR